MHDAIWINLGAAGGRLPLVIQFIDTAEDEERVTPAIKRTTGDRLVIRGQVEVIG